MKIDIYTLQETVSEWQKAIDKVREERAEQFKKRLNRIHEKNQEINDEIRELMNQYVDKQDEAAKVKMEIELDEAVSKAKQETIEQYRKEHPAEWNESPIDKALRSIAKSISK